MESQILSRIRYVAPFVAGETEDLKSKVYKLMKDSERFVMKSYCYKQRMSAIFKEIGWKDPEETVDECSALFIHKIIHTNPPLITIYRNKTATSKTYWFDPHKHCCKNE